MWLLLDIGNSSTKFGLWDGSRVARTLRTGPGSDEVSNEQVRVWLDGSDISRVGGVSVVPVAATGWRTMVGDLTDRVVEMFDATSLLPFDLTYRTPETLGNDRIAAACAGWTHQGMLGKRGVLIVDAGTAVTYDLVRADGTYPGGVIAPGPELLRRGLRDGTAQLPFVELTDPPLRIGRSTEEAMRSGVMYGFLASVEDMIAGIVEEAEEACSVVLTGGWGAWLSDRLQIGHRLERDLVLAGVACLMGLCAEK